MNNYDNIVNTALNSLSETELEALAKICQERANKSKQARREALRQELKNNLQRAINNVLNNGFELIIGNDAYETCEVQLLPDDIYSITIK